VVKAIIRKIYKKIKDYEIIVVARHVGPDPDAITTQIALRDSIKLTFPEKSVYAVGASVSRFKQYGTLDKINENDFDKDALLIVVDVPNISRVDVGDITKYKEIVKIDHHPYEDKMGEVEWVDTTSCSAAQLVSELILNTRLKLNKTVASNLFCGIASDSDRFLLTYTTPKTFNIVSKLLEFGNINLSDCYNKLYERPMNEIRFQGYIGENLTLTDNGLAYIIINDDVITKYGVDAGTASNMVNNFNYIKEVKVWVFVTFDVKTETYRVNIRSRGPVINTIASHYNGGGHAYASGVKTKNKEDIDNLIKELDNACR